MPATTTEIYCPVYDSAALHYSGPVSDGLGYNGQLTAEASDLSPSRSGQPTRATCSATRSRTATRTARAS
jgi:hypothetical protein